MTIPSSYPLDRPARPALVAIAITLALIMILFGGAWLMTRPASTVPEAAPPPVLLSSERTVDEDPAMDFSVDSVIGAGEAVAGQAAPPDVAPDVAPELLAEQRVVALVNGVRVEQAALDVALAADAAMASLLNQPPPDRPEAVERLVNGELVRQAALLAGFAFPEGLARQELDALLSHHGKEWGALEAALQAQQLSVEGFLSYFEQLLLVDRFVLQQSSARGEVPAEVIRTLQQGAQVSFGPAAAALFESEPTSAGDVEIPTSAAAPADPISPLLGMEVEVQQGVSSPAEHGVSVSAGGARGTTKGQVAPAFDAAALNHETEQVTLDEFLGEPLVLSFFTTWCPYCERQTPVLVDASQSAAYEGIRFLGVDVNEGRDPVQRYITRHEMPYPVALDGAGTIGSQYNITGFPTTYFLDSDGRVVARHVGQLSPEKLASYMSQLQELSE